MSYNIMEALSKCNSYADRGYSLAKQSYNEIHQALLKEEEKIKTANMQQQKMTRIADSENLKKAQKNFITFKEMDKSLQNDLNLLHKNQKEFSIVVFGRTMAGKSTLMEILTHGNGASIGMGGQRTTLDVRDYHWQGMKITDVPGICSFDGREDDRLAMEAAKTADLILFLITDDAPQMEEAEKLAELRRLGKPVLGVVNVKLALNLERRAMALRNLKNRLEDVSRLNDICNQFKKYAVKYNQDWEEMPFIYTHLRAAFLGQSSQNDDIELFNMSNFPQVEKYIIEKVCVDGCFLRIKTFIDSVAVPMQKRIELLLENSTQNAKEGYIYRKKWHQLDNWTEKFIERTQTKLNKFIENLRNQINSDIEVFSEEYYESSYAGEKWNKHITSMHIEEKCMQFLQEIADECAKKRRELTDELKTEIEFNSTSIDASSISMDDITDTQGLMQIGALGVGLLFSGPIGIGLGLLSFFFEDRDEKRRKQQRELRNRLKEKMDPAIDQIEAHLIKELNDNILGKGINELKNLLVSMDYMLFEVAAKEADLAWDLRCKLYNLNAELLIEAEKYVMQTHTEISNTNDYCIYDTARIPGHIFYGLGTGNIPEKICKLISNILGEKTIYMSISEDEKERNEQRWDIITDWIGTWYTQAFEFNENDRIVLLDLPSNKSLQSLKNDTKYRLSEQIMGLPLFEK